MLLFAFFFFMLIVIWQNSNEESLEWTWSILIQSGSQEDLEASNEENLENLMKKTQEDIQTENVEAKIPTIEIFEDGDLEDPDEVEVVIASIDSGVDVPWTSLFDSLSGGSGTVIFSGSLTPEEANNALAEIEERSDEINEKLEEKGESLFVKIFGKKEEKNVIYFDEETQQWKDNYGICNTCLPEYGFNADGTMSDVTDTPKKEVVEEKPKKPTEKPKEPMVTQSTGEDTTGKVLAKNTNTDYKHNYTDIYAYAPEVLGVAPKKKKIHYPWKNLKTYIGKQYEIWVHSLKLNDKTFTQKLGYMMKGDRVKQLTKENSKWCFQVEVMSSVVKKSNGKTGYVCKKYLRDITGDDTMQDTLDIQDTTDVDNSQISDTSAVTPTNTDNTDTMTEPHSINTCIADSKVGDEIIIEFSSEINGYPLVFGDVVEQLSPLDAAGCFTAYVHVANNPNSIGKVGTLCYANIK